MAYNASGDAGTDAGAEAGSPMPGDWRYWSDAGRFMLAALRILVETMRDLPAIERPVSAALGDYFTAHPDMASWQGAYNRTPEDWAALDAIGAPLSAAWDRISFATRSAVLMGIIYLESAINVCCHRVLGEATAEAIEPLQIGRKLQVLHAMAGEPAVKQTALNEALHELIEWRNRFTHGKVPALPRSLRQQSGPRHWSYVDSPDEELTEMIHLLRRFLVVSRHLDRLMPAPAYSLSEDYPAIERDLEELDRYAVRFSQDHRRVPLQELIYGVVTDESDKGD